MKKIASLFPVLFFLYTLKAQTCITIDPTLPPSESCNFKIGYRLIFQDEFNSFNSDSWDISSPGGKPPTNPILVIRYSSPLHGMTNFMLGVSSMAAVILTVAKV